MLFILIYLLLFLVIHLNTKNKSNSTLLQFIWCLMFLIIVFGFRDLQILNDTNHYYLSQYELLTDSQYKNSHFFYVDISNRFEIGFQIYQGIIGRIWDNPFGIILFSSIIISAGQLWYISKHTKNISLFIFFMLASGSLFGYYSAIRQSFAVLCFYLAMNLRAQEKWKMPLLLCIIAFQFHHSAIIVFPFLVLTFFKINKKNVTITILVLSIVLYAIMPIVALFGKTDSIYYEQAIENKGTAWFSIISSLTSFILFLYCILKAKQNDIQLKNNILLWGCIFSLFFSIASIIFPIFTRYGMYFGIYMMILIFHVCENLPNTMGIRVLLIYGVFLLIRLSIILIYRNEWWHLVPYSFMDSSFPITIKNFGY